MYSVNCLLCVFFSAYALTSQLIFFSENIFQDYGSALFTLIHWVNSRLFILVESKPELPSSSVSNLILVQGDIKLLF